MPKYQIPYTLTLFASLSQEGDTLEDAMAKLEEKVLREAGEDFPFVDNIEVSCDADLATELPDE